MSVVSDVATGIALGKQERAQIGVIDARRHLRRHDRLGAEGDAEARRAQHRQVVRAIADRDRRFRPETARGRARQQCFEFCVPADDRLGDLSGQRAAVIEKDVGALQVEPDQRRHFSVK